MATISTAYEIRKPSNQFYSVSKAGFTDVGAVIIDAIDGILSQGAMQVINVVFTDSTVSSLANGGTAPNPKKVYAPIGESKWPPREKLFTITNTGIGYKVGDKLELAGRSLANIAEPRFTINITAVTNTGSITSFHQIDNGPTANSAALAMTFVDSGSTSFLANTASGFTLGNVTAGTGIATGSLVIPTIASTDQFATLYGADGGGGTAGSSWPESGLVVPYDRNILPGQLVLLDTAKGFATTSNIQANTRVVSVSGNLLVTTGMAFSNEQGYFPFKTAHLNIIVDKPITVSRKDRIIFRGADAVFENYTRTRVPDNFTTVLETTGAIDPLSDQNGVFGNVVTTTSSSNVVQINNLTITGNPWTPRIYAGQQISSTVTNGSVTSLLLVSAVEPAVINAGSFVTGREYIIKTVGNTSFTSIGSSANTVGTTFLATGSGSGTGTAIDRSISQVTLNRNHSFNINNERLRFSFAETQPWRLQFEVIKNTAHPTAGPQAVNVYAATELQLTDDVSFANVFSANGASIVDRAGLMGNVPTGANGTISSIHPDQGFLNRTTRVNNSPKVFPLNYLLTMTNRGLFFGMWEGNWSTLQKTRASIIADKDNYFNWFLIQRPVNRVTGQVLTTGNAPVFCVNSVGYKYWKFIVRESDVPHPTQGPVDCKSYFSNLNPGNANIQIQTTPYRSPADAHSTDSFAVLNSINQIALTEDSKYLVSFIHNLTTPRFRYSEELDMIGQTSADVCGSGLDVSITAYEESGPRQYRALPSNGPFNSGLRICVIKDIP